MNCSIKHLSLWSSFWGQPHAEEAGYLAVYRAFEEAVRRAGLTHSALHQQADAVRDGVGLVVRDEDHGDAGLLLQHTDCAAQFFAQARL